MKACSQCPWRLSNQGKRHPGSFYTKANLTRLWNQIRRGGKRQSCHMTDPSHPDHLMAGCKPDTTPKECPGSVLLILREVESMMDSTNYISEEAIKAYLKRRRHGLTKKGILYWLVARIQFADMPLVGSPGLPDVEEDEGVGLPHHLRDES